MVGYLNYDSEFRRRSGLLSGGCFGFWAGWIAMYCLLTPFWVIARGIALGYAASLKVTVGTGPFIQSYSKASLSTIYGWGWDSYWLWNSEVTNDACKDNLFLVDDKDYILSNITYSAFGQYFCENGEYTIPSAGKVIQAFSIMTCVFGIIGGSIAMLASNSPMSSHKQARVSFTLTALATLFAIVAFSQAAAWDYYQGLTDGTAAILVPLSNTTDNAYTLLKYTGGMWFGSAFWLMVINFILLLCGTVVLFGAMKEPDFEAGQGDVPPPAREDEVELTEKPSEPKQADTSLNEIGQV